MAIWRRSRKWGPIIDPEKFAALQFFLYRFASYSFFGVIIGPFPTEQTQKNTIARFILRRAMTRAYPVSQTPAPETAYKYNYTYVPPLAMVQTVPASEGFSARPQWICLVALSALKVLINSLMIEIRQYQGSTEY